MKYRNEQDNIQEVIDRIKKEYKDKCDEIILSYGGDGTLLQKIRENFLEHFEFSEKRIPYYLPIRNYNRCKEHTDINSVVDRITENRVIDGKCASTLCCPLRCIYYDSMNRCFKFYSVSEFVVKNADPTSCLRLDLDVNGKTIYENIMCDGIIISTDVIGSHGYFKSVTRTTFKLGMGFAFINPTYGLTNCILSGKDEIMITFKRKCDLILVADKEINKISLDVDHECMSFQYMLNDPFCLFNYDIFMCPKCRTLRNSTVMVNDYYIT